MTRARRTPLYGNCMIVAPDGQPLCRTNQKKIDWYLERDLGEIIANDPVTLRLRFEPAGRKGADHPYNTSRKENHCVCCGGTDEITRHHVVPHCFRKFFPDDRKNHCLHDVLPLCIPCHDKYEKHASDLKKKYSQSMGIPTSGIGCRMDKMIYSVRAAAHALKNFGDRIPTERREMLLGRLRTYLKKEDITEQDILAADALKPMIQEEGFKPFGQCVVERITNIDAFILEWRQHFVKYMKPQHLPEHWSVDNEI